MWSRMGGIIRMNKNVRLIDANAIVYVQSENGSLNDYAYRHDINKMPTIEPDSMRPHGKWIKPTNISGLSLDVYHCSACDAVPCGVDKFTKYCPYCGAKMEV